MSLFLFSNGVFHLRSSPLLSSFNLFNLSRFLVSLVCQRSNFVLPLLLPFLPGDISRISGRDPLLVWESCDARDRRPRRFQKIPDVPGCPCVSFELVLFIFALHHVIMPSCHILFCISTLINRVDLRSI